MVARMNNLPEAELERFLFGSERTPLDAVRSPRRDLLRGDSDLPPAPGYCSVVASSR